MDHDAPQFISEVGTGNGAETRHLQDFPLPFGVPLREIDLSDLLGCSWGLKHVIVP